MQRPADALRSAVATQGVALSALVGLALLARANLGLSVVYPLKAAAPFAVVMLLALGRLREYHPFARFGPANQITTVRAVLVALVAGLIGESAAPIVAAAAASVSGVVTLLDGVDGWWARRTRMVSAFGARFDMETDAVLIQALAILAWQYGKAGWWVLASGLLRYVFVAAGWLWSWIERPLPSSRRRKAICVIQIVALVLAIVPAIAPPASTAIAAAGLLALAYSFLVDTLWLWRRAGTSAVSRTQ